AADKPTGRNVRGALKALLAGRDKHDTVLVALSGHGIQLKVKDGEKEKDEGFFCPAHAPLNDTDTLINRGRRCRDLDLGGAGRGRWVVAACRNDLEDGGKGLDTDYLPKPANGTVALFSCSSGQKSYETRKLGGGHGVFFHYVLEGLRGKAPH